ncbi:MAG: cytochrome-c peroxidase [Deltaproteobacteria bacterium]|nr:cytochrome-c peroxidase [Deltaproteobacteria bacterium]
MTREHTRRMKKAGRAGRITVLGGAVLSGAFLAACPTPPAPVIDPGPGFRSDLASSLSLDPRTDEASTNPRLNLPPITGGTLYVTERNALVVSDPDRARVLVVDLVTRRVMGEVSLPNGAFPARIAEDADGGVHVVLRGLGEVVSFDPRHPEGAQRHEVCAAPRGIGYDAEADVLRVGCTDGSLDTLSTDGTLVSRVQLGVDDLRDVLPIGGRLYVTTFRSAEIHTFDRDLQPISSTAPETRPDSAFFDGSTVNFLPEVAWRTVVHGSSLVMVHQRGAERVSAAPTTPAYYGNGFGCGSGVVESVVTTFEVDPRDGELRPGQHFSVQSATLPVDIGVSPTGDVVMVSAAEQGSMPSAYRVDPDELAMYASPPCDQAWTAVPEHPTGGAIAVAFGPNGESILQMRDPAALVIGGTTIPLGGESRFDSGHALFHGNAGLGLACASCHPEGGDDGRVWEFPGFPPLRTPAMHGGIASTAPFHWTGDMPSMSALMNEVFERRMGGPTMLQRHEDALAGWVDQLPGSPPREGLDADAVDRGARLFWGEAECASCHTGGMLTDNRSYDVGTNGTFQVPSLVGVSYRLPVMHDGCAETLRQRFDPSCGGDRHGRTSHLNEGQLGDLVTYLQTL